MIMSKTPPNVAKMKKPEIIKAFNDLWESSYKLSKSLDGHHANAEGLLHANERIRKDNKRLSDKVDWLEDRLVHLSANQAKDHNRRNYGLRQRKIRLNARKKKIRSLINICVLVGISFCLYKWILPLHWSILIAQVVCVGAGLLLLLYILDNYLVRTCLYLRRLITGSFWRR